MRGCNVLLPLLFSFIAITVSARQDLPDRLFNSISKKSAKLEQKIDRQTEKYLARLAKQEKRLYDKLRKKDPAIANSIIGDINNRYGYLKKITGTQAIAYNAHFDSIHTALQFLDAREIPAYAGKIKDILAGHERLLGKFSKADEIGRQLKARQQYLKQELEKAGLVKEFRKFREEVYYYRAQVNEYRSILAEPSKLEAKFLSIAGKIPAFKDFFNKHSALASLFRVPDDYGSMASLQGLQTRVEVQAMIDRQIASGAPGAREMVQQHIADVQSQLQGLKKRINEATNGGEDDMPDFKPNNQRTKSFLKRLEFGANIQTQKAQYYFPVTSDIGLSVGYKLNDKSVIGIGASYKLGLGKGWNDLQLTHQGVGLRSFAEWKLKGSFYLRGGYEQNYRAAFNNIGQLKDKNAWQQSALAGISKKYRISKKFRGNMQLLYDFLHAKQVPETQPVAFRLGYSF